MTKTYTFRLTAEGLTELQNSMNALGTDGQKAFQKIVDATPGMAGALDLAGQKAEQARNKLRDAGQGAKEFGEAIGVAKEVLGAFGIALSIGSVVEFGKSVLDTVAGLDAQARVAGVSVQALQAYRQAAREANVPVSDMDSAIQRFTRSMGDATAATGPARSAFYDLKLGADALAGGPEAALPKVAAALLAIPDAAARARDEVALFGKSGQEIEPILRRLALGTATLEDRARLLGTAFDEDLARKADDAVNRLETAFQRVEVSAAPRIVSVANHIADLVDWLHKLGAASEDPNAWWNKPIFGGGPPATHPGGPGQVGPDLGPDGGKPFIIPTIPATDYGAFGKGNAFGAQEWDKFVAGAKEEAQLAGLSATERAAELEAIKFSVEKQTEQGVLAANLNKSYDYAKASLDGQTLAQARSLGIQGQQSTAAQKLKETYDGFLASLDEQARLAGETANQRKVELDTIKAIQVIQTEGGALPKDLVQTYGQAVQKAQQLGKTEVINQVARRDAATQAVALGKQLADQQTLATAAASASADQRELAVQIAQKELELGRSLTDTEKERLALVQKTNDAANLKDLITNLKEQVQLAGMLPDEAERYGAVLQAVHASHQNITDDQRQEIDLLIQARQQAEKLQAVVAGIQDGYKSFFETFLETGKLDFSSLLDSWKQTFAKFLADAAAQAITQPIIIPMVEQIVGGIGGAVSGVASLFGGGSSSGGGALGSLSSLSSLGSLGGLGGSSGLLGSLGSSITSGINGIGSFLGFSPGISTAAGLSGAAGGISTISSPLGSIFGSTTLGGFLGAAGAGSLASSLIFGNKNDASIGGMGGSALGAAIGSIIPGVGTLIGGLLGGVLGGGLGSITGSDNQSTIANLTNGGQGYSIGQTGSAHNTQLVTQAAQAINQAVTALTQAGVTLNNDISGIGIGSSKDYLYFQGGGKQKLGSAADPGDVVTQALNHLLGSAASQDPNVSSVIASYKGQGGINSTNLSQFLSDIGFAQSIKNIQFGDQQLSQAGQALKQISDQFDAAIQKAQTLGLDTTDIVNAKATAIQTLIDNFDDGIAASLKSLTDPMAASFDTLIANQKARLKDAQDLGANIDQVVELNSKETAAAIQQYLAPLQAMALPGLSGFAQQIANIARAAAQATTAAQDLGLSLDDINTAAGSAYQLVRDQFNNGIADSLNKIVNPALATYNEMLLVQQQRIADATTVGGDLNQVLALNAAETQQYYDQQAQAAADALAQQKQAAAQARASLGSLIQDLIGGADSGLAPDQKYFTLLSQFNSASASALNAPTDPGSIANFQSAAQALLPAAREFLGTSQSYGALTNNILATATKLGGSDADPNGIARAILQSGAATVASTSATTDAVASLQEDIKRLNALLQALLARQAA